MKVAVLLFGHLRNFEECADSLREHVLNHYDCDVFMHTWDERDVKTHVWHEKLMEPTLISEKEQKSIIKKYCPKAITIEHQTKYDKEEIINSAYTEGYKISTASLHFMFYSLNAVNELRHEYEKKNNIDYDYVLCTRPDIRFLTDLDIPRIIQNIDYFQLDVSKCRFYATTQYTPNATFLDSQSDVLYFSRPNVIDRFIDANINIDNEYVRKYSMGTNSIYTRREIAAGIIPIAISYIRERDWAFSISRVSKMQMQKKQKSIWKRILINTIRDILKPIAYILYIHPSLNYYKR